MSDYKPTGKPHNPIPRPLHQQQQIPLPYYHSLSKQSHIPLTIFSQRTTVSARTASPTSASAPASSHTARSTPPRPAKQAARLAAQPVDLPARAAAVAVTTSPPRTTACARTDSQMAASRETRQVTWGKKLAKARKQSCIDREL